MELQYEVNMQIAASFSFLLKLNPCCPRVAVCCFLYLLKLKTGRSH